MLYNVFILLHTPPPVNAAVPGDRHKTWRAGAQRKETMKVINNILQLPDKFYMVRIDGATPEDRFASAQKEASERNHCGAWYVERKDYKSSAAYLFLAVKL